MMKLKLKYLVIMLFLDSIVVVIERESLSRHKSFFMFIFRQKETCVCDCCRKASIIYLLINNYTKNSVSTDAWWAIIVVVVIVVVTCNHINF